MRVRGEPYSRRRGRATAQPPRRARLTRPTLPLDTPPAAAGHPGRRGPHGLRAQDGRRRQATRRSRPTASPARTSPWATTASTQGAAQRAKLAADAYYFSKQKEAEALLAQKSAEAKGVLELNRAMASSGGRTNVKLAIARALQGKKIVLVPGGGNSMGLQRIDRNDLIKSAAVRELTPKTEN